jgi:hypothetical protein
MTLKSEQWRRADFYLATFASLLAFSITVIRGLENTSIQDAKDYVLMANNMLNGWDYVVSNNEQFQRTIGFPFLIFSTFVASSSQSLLLIKIIMAVSHGLSVLLLGRISKILGLSRALSALVMIFFAIDPFLLISATDVQTEPLTTLIVIYWAYLYLTFDDHDFRNCVKVILFTISGFLGILIRPNIIVPFGLLSLLFVIKLFNNGGQKRWITYSFATFLFLISIYEFILYRIYGVFVFLSAQGGIGTLFTCKKELIPQYLGFASSSKNAEINSWVLNHLAIVIESIKISNPGISTGEINDELFQIGINECKDSPLSSAITLSIKIISLWRPFTVFGAYSPTVFILSALIWIPLTIAAIWFIAKKHSSRRLNEIKVFFVLLSLGFTISLLMTPTQIRHRVAFAEPFYWIFFIVFMGELQKGKTAQAIGSKLRFNHKSFRGRNLSNRSN